MYRIQASNKTCHLISKDAARLSDYLKTQCELGSEEEPIEIWPDTPEEQIRLLIDFLEIAKDKPTLSIRRPLVGQGDLTASGMPPWALDWLNKLFEGREVADAWDLVFALLNIADFINYEGLVKVLASKVASRICAMDEVSKQSIFAPSRELTEEEKQKIRTENAWAEMDPPGND